MSNEDYIKNKALVYLRYKDQFDEIDSVDLRQFRLEVERAFNEHVRPFVTVEFVKGQPYKDHHELTHDIKRNQLMKISSDHNDSCLLPNELNLQFRAVHDYIHYILQAPFTAMGEVKVYNFQKRFHQAGICQQILFSEVVLQACYCEYYGEFAPFQKVILYKGKIWDTSKQQMNLITTG